MNHHMQASYSISHVLDCFVILIIFHQINFITGNRSAMKGLGIGIALVTFAHSTANYTIQSYAVLIFQATESSIDPHICSIVVAATLIPASILSTYFADTMGRKMLILISLMGSALGLFSMASYHTLGLNGYDLTSFGWIPVVSISFVIFSSSVGIMPNSFICSVEVLPPKVCSP